MQRLYCVFESYSSLQLEFSRWIFIGKFEILILLILLNFYIDPLKEPVDNGYF
jgi:hypothetical protein